MDWKMPFHPVVLGGCSLLSLCMLQPSFCTQFLGRNSLGGEDRGLVFPHPLYPCIFSTLWILSLVSLSPRWVGHSTGKRFRLLAEREGQTSPNPQHRSSQWSQDMAPWIIGKNMMAWESWAWYFRSNKTENPLYVFTLWVIAFQVPLLECWWLGKKSPHLVPEVRWLSLAGVWNSVTWKWPVRWEMITWKVSGRVESRWAGELGHRGCLRSGLLRVNQEDRRIFILTGKLFYSEPLSWWLSVMNIMKLKKIVLQSNLFPDGSV